MLYNFDLEQMAIHLPGIILAITVHEYAHAYVADRLGDPTPAYSNRLTLNPIPHLDVFGFLMLMIAGFGWAKPVPINPARFKGDRRTGLILVSVAGCCANLIAAFTGFLIFNLSVAGLTVSTETTWMEVLKYGITINLVLAVFNMIPIPPLDGSKVLETFLPSRFMNIFYWLERYGTLILMILIFFTGIFRAIIYPIINILAYGMNMVAMVIANLIF